MMLKQDWGQLKTAFRFLCMFFLFLTVGITLMLLGIEYLIFYRRVLYNPNYLIDSSATFIGGVILTVLGLTQLVKFLKFRIHPRG